MKRLFSVALAALAVFALASQTSCTKDNPKTCNESAECGSNGECVLYICVARGSDASADGLRDDAHGGASALPCSDSSGCGGTTPVCDDIQRVCVQCAIDAQCPASRSSCLAGVCVGCTSASCSGRPEALCSLATGECVACLTSSDCAAALAPVCAQGACVKCTNDQQCETKGGRCDGGRCVECLLDAQCAVATKPICADGVCSPCTADGQCANKGGPNPGVCMSHVDGRCASSVETLYVRNDPAICTNTVAEGGRAEKPYCHPQVAIDALTPTKRVVVLRGPDALKEMSIAASVGMPVTVVGQQDAQIAPGTEVGVHVRSGSVFLRNLLVRNSEQAGIVAAPGSTLHAEGVAVKNNAKGGLLIDGANFSVRRSIMQGNGPGDDAGAAWGGVRIKTGPRLSPAILESSTITGNLAPGVSCTDTVAGKDVLVQSNSAVNITASCGFGSCAMGTAGCGAP